MDVAFTDREARVSAFYRADLMAGHDQYQPPHDGPPVHEDDDGVRWFSVVAEVGEALVDEDGYEPYDEGTTDSSDSDSED